MSRKTHGEETSGFRWRRTYAIGTGLVAVGWLVGAFVVVPRLLTAAYHGRSLPWLNHLITGQELHPVEHYTSHWHALALQGTVALVAGLVIGVVALLAIHRWGPSARRAITGWATDGQPAMSTAGALAVWGAVGLLAGYAELGVVHVRRALQIHPGWEYSPLAPWMTPLANGVLFLAIGAILVTAAARGRRRYVNVRTMLGLALALALFSLGRLGLGRIHGVATLVLAVGIASRVVSFGRARFATRTARAAPWIAAALGLAVATTAALT